jgi:hypothetical protein
VARSLKLKWRTANAYQTCFGTESGKIVLQDLFKFCEVANSVPSENREETGYILGKRRVWLRIAAFLGVDMQTLFQEAMKEGMGDGDNALE